MEPLQGTLEAVVIKGVYRAETATAYGIVKRNEQPVNISNGTYFLGEEVVVRTDSLMSGAAKYPLKAQTGNFVAVEIPPEMRGKLHLSYWEYILTGILPWNVRLPDLNDVNAVFNPGKIGYLPFFPVEGSGMIIYPNGQYSFVDGYQEAIDDRLTINSRKYARVILVETHGQISELESAIKENRIIPVRMQPLPPKKAEPTVAVATSLH